MSTNIPPLPPVVLRGLTIEDAILRISESAGGRWTCRWWTLNEVIVGVPDATEKSGLRSWATKKLKDVVPFNVAALGCSGADPLGNLAWFGFDLDVGHGKNACYQTTDEALADARRIHEFLEGRTEIRLSKSGRGVHVRHLLPHGPVTFPADGGPPRYSGWMPRPASDGAKIAKAISAKLNLKADPSALGRQAHWLWCADLQPDSFKLIEAHP